PLSNLPLGPAGTAGRRIYRMAAGGAFSLVATLNDNTPRTFTDTAGVAIDPAGVPVLTRPTAPTSETTAVEESVGGTVVAGTYTYQVSFLNATGQESEASEPALVTFTGAASRVTLNNIPLGPADTAARRIYRMGAGGTFILVGTLNDNASRRFTDTLGVAKDVSVVANQGGSGAPDVVAAATTATDGGAGGQLQNVLYTYRLTFLSNAGVESNASAARTVTPLAANSKVVLARLPLGPAGTVARRIYRMAA